MERVAENLNRALHAAFAADPDLFLLGEDVADPYGGAFKITKGLSSGYPDRVLSTPISEQSLVGVANGLALSGGRAIVEIMFGDFATLAFDQIVNFAAKSVAMYGRRVEVPVIVRCPTGGRRGYGPTHSQSLQKHFIGVPHLSVYEISPFHDSTAMLAGLLADGEPAVLFEDKVLYTQPMHEPGTDGPFVADFPFGAGGPARLRASDGDDAADCVIIVPGGVARRALEAAGTLFAEHEITCEVIVPTRLYPFDVEPLLPALAGAEVVCLVEDCAAGGTWGSEVAARVYERLWGRLRRPVVLCSAEAEVIPTAAHLEQTVLPQASDIHRAIWEALHA
ncbi:transketolase C-terminal domain-containing protein [Streptomyces sp. NPDC048045]|uniref:alpha-ketoacid dehydrogenase subunit beta n=1 Tax=Streptomyces sp. NPDC048045 TaxID=3154710 RepID=UPI00343D1CB7